MAEACTNQDGRSGVAEKMRASVDHHREGRIAEAERGYAAVLAEEPRHSDALHLLGVLHYQRGNAAEALRLVAASLRINPRSADALSNFGLILDLIGRPIEALAAYDEALTFRPDDTDALFNRGNALCRLGRYQEAISDFDKVLAIRSDHIAAWNNRGSALRAIGRPAEALESFGRTLAIKSDDIIALNNCGATLQDLDRHAEALSFFDKALAIHNDLADVHCNRGHSLRALGRPDEALESFARSLAIKPDHVAALYNRGNGLRDLGRDADAIESYEAALAIKPDHADTLYNRGNALAGLGKFEAALASFDKAIEADPSHAAAFNNRGNMLVALGRHREALASHAQAVALAPDDAEFNFNEGAVRLRLSDFAGGWDKYEWRLMKDNSGLSRALGSQRWRGEGSIRGKVIMLHGEQGLGDTLQFVRYVPRVAALGASVVLEVQPELKDLLRGIPGADEVVARGENLPAHDLHCPLPSLPLAFASDLHTIPAQVPYVAAHPDRIARWAERLAAIERPRVGVVWAGNPNHPNDHRRSIPLAHFAGLFDGSQMRFVALQRDLRDGDLAQLTHWPEVSLVGADLRDFSDTAAVISLLDLVVSIDSSVAHLAGAMGKPVWLLLPFAPDYRWLLDREDSPWYPTARLFRQPRPGDWHEVIGRVRGELFHRGEML